MTFSVETTGQRSSVSSQAVEGGAVEPRWAADVSIPTVRLQLCLGCHTPGIHMLRLCFGVSWFCTQMMKPQTDIPLSSPSAGGS